MKKDLLLQVYMVKWNKKIEFARTTKELQELDKVLSNPIFKNDTKPLSSKAKIYYQYIKGLYHFFTGNFHKSVDNFQKQLSTFENNPQFKETNPIQYIRCIGKSLRPLASKPRCIWRKESHLLGFKTFFALGSLVMRKIFGRGCRIFNWCLALRALPIETAERTISICFSNSTFLKFRFTSGKNAKCTLL